ncbi:trichohyalin-like [Gambusia affinis]|uniref:trichohyalin-like n=1 Tax=Gambusia affinis TaxID=33528 RepID=UPI001CDC691F|nr:trichohyalin-like [Gambusia affinis]
MDSRRLPRRVIPMLRKKKKTQPSEDVNGCLENKEPICLVSNVVSIPEKFKPSPNNSGPLENKRHPEKGKNVQGASEPDTEIPQIASKGDRFSVCKLYERCKNILHDKLEAMRQKKPAKKALSKEKELETEEQEFCPIVTVAQDAEEREKRAVKQKPMVWDARIQSKKKKKRGMEETRRQEAKAWCPVRRQKHFNLPTAKCTEVLGKDKYEQFKKPSSCKKKEKLVIQVTENADDQVIMQWQKYKRVSGQKEDAKYESDCPNYMSEMRLPEKFSSLEDCKKIVYDNLEDLKKKEAANLALLAEKRCKERAKLQLGQKIRDKQERERKAKMKKSLTDMWDAQVQCKQQKKEVEAEIERQQMAAIMESNRLDQIDKSLIYQYNQQKKREMDRDEKLPRSDKLQDETKTNMDTPDVMQWEMYHSVTDQGTDFQYDTDFLEYDSDCDIYEKDRSREIRKKIVYDQLSLIQKEAANKRALMEEKLLKEKKHQEFVQQMREKLEKEKRAAAIKALTDSWDSQIKRKQQEKKKLRESERKDMLSLLELERVCENQENKRTQLPKHKMTVYQEVQETIAEEGPERSCSSFYVGRTTYSADKHDDA